MEQDWWAGITGALASEAAWRVYVVSIGVALFAMSIVVAKDARDWLAALKAGDFSAPRTGNKTRRISVVQKQLAIAEAFQKRAWLSVWFRAAALLFFGVAVPTAVLVSGAVLYPWLLSGGAALVQRSEGCGETALSQVQPWQLIGLVTHAVLTEDGAKQILPTWLQQKPAFNVFFDTRNGMVVAAVTAHKVWALGFLNELLLNFLPKLRALWGNVPSRITELKTKIEELRGAAAS